MFWTSLLLTGASLCQAFTIKRQAVQSADARCTAFRPQVDTLTLVNATYVPANTLVNITGLHQNLTADIFPAFCRLEVLISTDPEEGTFANTEIWLPDNHNGRFMTFGNGGWAGGPPYGDMAYIGILNGFATMGSNCGHNSTNANASWGLNNPAASIDFAGRAIAMSVTATKTVIEHFYGTATNKSYYNGCSTGGRQGLKFVQEYPEMFDGVIAGAPASYWTHLLPWEGHMSSLVQPVNSSRFITPVQWAVIHGEVLAQCDVLDGVKDAVIQDPRSCHFRPETLACTPGQNASQCLNSDQIDALKHVYADCYETGQTYIYPRLEPGFELGYAALFDRTPLVYPANLFRYFIFNSTDPFDVSNVTYENIQLADNINPGGINAINPNITAFINRGGKLLQYHGLADDRIAPGSSTDYYNSVYEYLRLNTNLSIDDHYKYYQVPGMAHCSLGEGANAFGATGQARRGMPALDKTPQYDIVAALVEWVEAGTAPDHLVAAHYLDNNSTQGIEFTRPLCAYPRKAVFKGSGNGSQAEDWECSSM